LPSIQENEDTSKNISSLKAKENKFMLTALK
jgi:hypothetical protein